MSFLDPLDEVRAICPKAQNLAESGHKYIDLPDLQFMSNGQTITRHALLALDQHGGYTTRLFLSQPVPGKGQNWTIHAIFGRSWHTWSWNQVPPNLRPAQILAEHLRALR